ncbi:hypothetical protein K4749_04475 [Streptomyces sp. TRM72054]|uniref:hypothetical protein n=1 Tax=Streptomyces sp. TRM72054 TaxID=2870562 RepID=UPI001C8C601A|nr:hypothetical protein [Streptomyces sp. TRM72054]MBX9392862.1 hypothetical protein [Streptomyces sp. TRM72054]
MPTSAANSVAGSGLRRGDGERGRRRRTVGLNGLRLLRESVWRSGAVQDSEG